MFNDRDKILSQVGYTPAQIELAEYQATNYAKQLKAEKYNGAKTSIGLNQKKQLEALVLLLLIENVNLATIIIQETNKKLKGNREND